MSFTSFCRFSKHSRRNSSCSSSTPIHESGWHMRWTLIVHARCEAQAMQRSRKAWESSTPRFKPSGPTGCSLSWSLPNTYSSTRFPKIWERSTAKDLLAQPARNAMLEERDLVASNTERWCSRSGFSAKYILRCFLECNAQGLWDHDESISQTFNPPI